MEHPRKPRGSRKGSERKKRNSGQRGLGPEIHATTTGSAAARGGKG